MKTIGLIGGTSWVSTIDYYRIINTTVNERLGGNESARIILHSVNYGEIIPLTFREDWDSIAAIICDAAQKIEKAGADCLLLCANTMHRIADRVQAAISIPVLHIAEVTARDIRAKGIDSVLLLGTRFTMTGGFYEQRLQQHGIRTLLPGSEAIEFINHTIFQELGRDIFLPETRKAYLDIIHQAVPAGAQGVILGCTEIPLLLKQEDCPVPVFDTTALHARAGVDFALG